VAGLKHRHGRWKHLATPTDVIPNGERDLLFAPSDRPLTSPVILKPSDEDG
jgi:hypothetical protein